MQNCQCSNQSPRRAEYGIYRGRTLRRIESACQGRVPAALPYRICCGIRRRKIRIHEQPHLSLIHISEPTRPYSKIHSEKVPSLDGRRIVFDEDITEFEAALTLFETRPMTDKTRGDCETSCTGACYTGCSGDCTGGCETTCSGECQGSCTGCGSGCANTCEGSCSGGCYGCGGNCTGGCSGSCDGSCSGCSGSCSGGCSSSCSGGCKSSCTVTCGNTGCVGSCLGLCSAGCTTSCQTSCGYCGTNCTAVSK